MQFATSVRMLKSVAESTRLRLLALLSHGELSVKDLTEILKQSQPRISRHLKLLTDSGVIVRYAEGAWAYFGLATEGEGATLVNEILGRLDANDPQILSDLERLSAVKAVQRQQAADYFAEVAESWDRLRGLHVPEEAVENQILKSVNGTTAQFMLDLGTGTGRMLELLSSHFTHGIGIDSSKEMLSVARAKLSDAKVRNAQVRLGDIAELGEYAGQADRIVIHQVLHYFDDPGATLKSARRALKPGGEMLIVDFAPHNLEFLRTEHAHRRLGLSTHQMEGWARAAGMDVVRVTEFPNEKSSEGLTVCLWELKALEG